MISTYPYYYWTADDNLFWPNLKEKLKTAELVLLKKLSSQTLGYCYSAKLTAKSAFDFSGIQKCVESSYFYITYLNIMKRKLV